MISHDRLGNNLTDNVPRGAEEGEMHIISGVVEPRDVTGIVLSKELMEKLIGYKLGETLLKGSQI